MKDESIVDIESQESQEKVITLCDSVPEQLPTPNANSVLSKEILAIREKFDAAVSPGDFMRIDNRVFILNANGTATPIDEIPEGVKVFDIDGSFIQDAVANKPVRFRKHPRDKIVRPYVNKKPCKRKQKKR